VHGTALEVEKARSILATTQAVNVTVHAPEAVGASAR